MQNDGIGNFDGCRQQIVRECAGQKTAVWRVGIFLVERRAQRLREPATNLAVDHGRMQDGATVMHRHVSVDSRCKRGPIDLDAAKVEMKPWYREELTRSCSSGAVSCGGVQNTVSRKVWPTSSGKEPGDQ